jgi:hypothetical protein
MLLELPWLQQSVLFLGHPSTATAVVLGSLLAGSGLGSLISGRVHGGVTASWFWLLPAAALGVSLSLGPLFRALLGQPLALRCAVAIGVFLVSGCMLGVALPSGMMRFSRKRRAWFWAVNGASGVLASALAMLLGLRNTALLGAAAYVVAALCYRRAPEAA